MVPFTSFAVPKLVFTSLQSPIKAIFNRRDQVLLSVETLTELLSLPFGTLSYIACLCPSQYSVKSAYLHTPVECLRDHLISNNFKPTLVVTPCADYHACRVKLNADGVNVDHYSTQLMSALDHVCECMLPIRSIASS